MKNNKELSFATDIGGLEINNGDWQDVSLLSVGEAKGHGLFVDKRSLQTAFEVAVGKSIKAFNNHSSSPDITECLGIFSGIHVDYEAGKLKAKRFKILDSYKDNFKAEYDILNELAENHPETFGVSLTFTFSPVWVSKEDESEVSAVGYWTGEDAPEGFEALPRVRFKSIISADIVSNPAANADGLFSEENEPEAEQEENTDLNDIYKGKIMIKEITDKFSDDATLLTEAVTFAAGEDVTTFEQVEAHIEQFKVQNELKLKDDEIETLKTQLSEKDTELTDLKSQLDALAGGEEEFSTGEEPTNTDENQPTLYQQFAQIRDYRAAMKFYNEHKAEIEAEKATLTK